MTIFDDLSEHFKKAAQNSPSGIGAIVEGGETPASTDELAVSLLHIVSAQRDAILHLAKELDLLGEQVNAMLDEEEG
jgi:hypothetical protein